MNFKPVLIVAASAAIAVAAVEGFQRWKAPSNPGAQRAEIQAIVKDYIVGHPEVVQEAMAELDKRQQLAEAEKSKAAVKNNSEKLFNSSRQVVIGNPQGDITLVEFFDYNCGYCKHALPDLVELMRSDSKVRVVLKEFPVLGPGSVEAAQVAVAARMQDKTGEKYLQFHLKLLGGRGQADKARALAVAREVGFDMAQMEKDMASDEARATLDESFKLADQLGVNGTPSYVVGSEVVVGAVGLPALKDKVKLARCAATTSC